jgi:hypothetical protein
MFIGHYGPAAAAAGGKVKLWHGFVAVQFLDILWGPFILLGIEHVRIVENFTASNHLDLYHMPYTHSLVMAVFWSIVVGAAYQFIRKGGGVIIGMLVFSHWVLDFIVHKPDLPLWFGGPKVGLGLWDNLTLALSAELGLFAAGALIYLKKTQAKNAIGRAAPLIIFALLAALQVYATFAPPAASANEFAATGFAVFVVIAALAAVIDAVRAPAK